MEPERVPVLQRVGAFFRRQIGDELGLRGPFRCKMCGEPTRDPARQWSPYLRGYVDLECIPAIVRRRGPTSTSHWLETGELLEGTPGERALTIMSTETRGFRR